MICAGSSLDLADFRWCLAARRMVDEITPSPHLVDHVEMAWQRSTGEDFPASETQDIPEGKD